MADLRRRLHLISLLTLLAALPALVLVVLGSPRAAAHGAPMAPGSRTFLCYRDAITPTGEIKPRNAACAAAAATGGTTPFYNWFSVLRSDGAGRTRGFVPDGQLCSGGNPNFTGFDQARTDWPLTHLTSGAAFTFSYNAWAAHPGSFHQYVTKDGFDPAEPLTWDALESTPFQSVADPPLSGTVGTVGGKYTWNGTLPANKSGRHVIYTVWQRSDSAETFYSCSDVVFDGGTGQVTGVGDGSGPTDPPPTGAACSAAYRTVGSWSGGYQGEVTVKNTGTTPILGWMVHFTLPGGQSPASVWNGVSTGTGTAVTVDNADWNGSLAVGASTTFGFVANGGAPDPAVAYSCMVM
ncbi:lytic polysaccharide monooxygenase [Kitasatospora sp. NPDC085895]|uniref:lytic polysaccharide monooxygenase auxiliary activity family 9 protein n=1 Tax=Kitasatospora sp. NPDC085895 TaxID=3155057 RepID=UPI00344E2E8C